MIKYMVLDVDGTLTDGGIYYDNNGNEIKKFNAKDGMGIVIARKVGIEIIVITGRECDATRKRMTELKVDYMFQKVDNKVDFLNKWMVKNSVDKNEIAYIGDDLNDLKAMKICGYTACPADAIEEVKDIVDYVASVSGGHGVVRDVIKHYLKEQLLWNEIINQL